MRASRATARRAAAALVALAVALAVGGCGPRRAAVGSRGDLVLAAESARRVRANALHAPADLALVFGRQDVEAWREGAAGAPPAETASRHRAFIVGHSVRSHRRRPPLDAFLRDPGLSWPTKALGFVIMAGAHGAGMPTANLGKIKVRGGNIQVQ